MNGTDEPRFRLGLARGALAWEQIWPAFWPPVGVAGLFIAIALFNVLPSLGGWLHALILLLFAAAFGVSVWFGIRRIRLPDDATALRRLERDSGLTHRPLAALRDTMAGAPIRPPALNWRLLPGAGASADAQPQGPAASSQSGGARSMGLRAAVGLLLFVGAFGTWGDWGPRINAALSPPWTAPPKRPTPRSTSGSRRPNTPVWLLFSCAPANRPQTAQDGDPAPSPPAIPVPTGSVLLACVSGGSGTPALTANGDGLGVRAGGSGQLPDYPACDQRRHHRGRAKRPIWVPGRSPSCPTPPRSSPCRRRPPPASAAPCGWNTRRATTMAW